MRLRHTSFRRFCTSPFRLAPDPSAKSSKPTISPSLDLPTSLKLRFTIPQSPHRDGDQWQDDRGWRSYDKRSRREELPPKLFRVMARDLIQELKVNLDSRRLQKSLGIDDTNAQQKVAMKGWLRRISAETLETHTKEEKGGNAITRRLRKAWDKDGAQGVQSELRYSLQAHVIDQNLSSDDLARHARLADLRYPAEWHPLARSMKREIHLHIGPTNSGKTYHALQRLMAAQSGVYAGPLRLLAHEVYRRILDKGRSCHLVTGDERIMSDDPACSLSSSTVEMLPMGTRYDVAVIDEIQMLDDNDRGWAWTNAVLGLPAAELHLCGEARSLDIIKAMAAATGEKVVVHEYKRLSPLEVGTTSLGGDITNVQPGDCLVAFSRAHIHAFASQISRSTPYKVAVIYGSLPPDTRAEQARLFNDPNSGYDIMVASNAIGMGLNLDIRRIIFATSWKFNGVEDKRLEITEVKQIGGRAGRYRVAPSVKLEGSNLDIQEPDNRPAKPNKQMAGIVTALRDSDLPFLRTTMVRNPRPIRTAGLKIPQFIIETFTAYLPPGTPLSYILNRLTEHARTSGIFRLCSNEEVIIADVIETVEGLSLEDRLILCASPVDTRSPEQRGFLKVLAGKIATRHTADLLTVLPGEFLLVLDQKVSASAAKLAQLEKLHKALTLYMWLSFRFPAVVVSGALASHTRSLCEQLISATLAALAEAGKITVKDKVRDETADQPQDEDQSEEQDESQDEDRDRDEGEEHDLHEQLRDAEESPPLSDLTDNFGNNAQGKEQHLRELILEERQLQDVERNQDEKDNDIK